MDMKIKAIAIITAAALLSGCGANTEEVSQDRVEQVRTTPLALRWPIRKCRGR